MRVVSEQSEADLRRREAANRVHWRYRELAANLLRVVRGAGSSADLLEQMAAVISASSELKDLEGYWPDSSVIEGALRLPDPGSRMQARVEEGRFSKEDIDRWERDGTLDVNWAEHEICRGVLQMCASGLLQQSTHRSVGHNEFRDGVRALNAALEKQRAHWAPIPEPPTPKPKAKRRRK